MVIYNFYIGYHQYIIINIHFYTLNYCIGYNYCFEINSFISMSIQSFIMGL